MGNEDETPTLNADSLGELSRQAFKFASHIERIRRDFDELGNGDRARAVGAIEISIRQFRRYWEVLTQWERMELALPWDTTLIKKLMDL